MALAKIVMLIQELQLIKKSADQIAVPNCSSYKRMAPVRFVILSRGSKEMERPALQMNVGQNRSLLKMVHALLVRIIQEKVLMGRDAYQILVPTDKSYEGMELVKAVTITKGRNMMENHVVLIDVLLDKNFWRMVHAVIARLMKKQLLMGKGVNQINAARHTN